MPALWRTSVSRTVMTAKLNSYPMLSRVSPELCAKGLLSLQKTDEELEAALVYTNVKPPMFSLQLSQCLLRAGAVFPAMRVLSLIQSDCPSDATDIRRPSSDEYGDLRDVSMGILKGGNEYNVDATLTLKLADTYDLCRVRGAEIAHLIVASAPQWIKDGKDSTSKLGKLLTRLPNHVEHMWPKLPPSMVQYIALSDAAIIPDLVNILNRSPLRNVISMKFLLFTDSILGHKAVWEKDSIVHEWCSRMLCDSTIRTKCKQKARTVLKGMNENTENLFLKFPNIMYSVTVPCMYYFYSTKLEERNPKPSKPYKNKSAVAIAGDKIVRACCCGAREQHWNELLIAFSLNMGHNSQLFKYLFDLATKNKDWAFADCIKTNYMCRSIMKQEPISKAIEPIGQLSREGLCQCDVMYTKPFPFFRYSFDEGPIWVDTPGGLSNCLNVLSSNNGATQVVGMDVEWRPAAPFIPGRPALLQLALSDRVYLIDLLSPKEPLISFLEKFFADTSIVKVGYGIGQDIPILQKVIGEKKSLFCRILDLESLSKIVFRPQSTIIEAAKAPPNGLSGLMELATGCVLDKTEQMSDWERRPLREAQKLYASLDTLCLFPIFDFLRNRIGDDNVINQCIIDR